MEKFVSRRTSSSGSKVGPAVTMQFMPSRYAGPGADESAFRFRHGTTFTAGSLQGPLPAELIARTRTPHPRPARQARQRRA